MRKGEVIKITNLSEKEIGNIINVITYYSKHVNLVSAP